MEKRSSVGTEDESASLRSPRNHETFFALVQSRYGVMLGWVRRAARIEGIDAEEVLDEAIVRACHAWEGFRGTTIESFLAWMDRHVHAEVVRHLRASREGPGLGEAELDARPVEANDVDPAATSTALLERLHDVMGRIRDAEGKRICVLVMQGADTQTIADEMHRSRRWVQKRLAAWRDNGAVRSREVRRG